VKKLKNNPDICRPAKGGLKYRVKKVSGLSKSVTIRIFYFTYYLIFLLDQHLDEFKHLNIEKFHALSFFFSNYFQILELFLEKVISFNF